MTSTTYLLVGSITFGVVGAYVLPAFLRWSERWSRARMVEFMRYHALEVVLAIIGIAFFFGTLWGLGYL